ncbi:MAG TPA: DUF6186 family protein [Acidimicrobiales bacterium]
MIGRHATLIVWVALGAVFVLGQLAATVSKGRVPGLGSLVGPIIHRGAGRYLLVLAWMWLGWHAFAR